MSGVIDYWCNPFTADFADRYYAQDEMRTLVDWWHMHERVRARTIPDFVAEMDQCGVAKAFIPTFKMRSYQKQVMMADVQIQDVLKYKEQFPDRFELLYGINPELKMTGVRELVTAVRDYGFIGAHLHTYGFGLPLNDRRYYPFYAKCVELDIPVVMQVGHSAEFMPSAMGRPILVDDIALDFPELRIVCSHTGWPWSEELVAVAWKHPNVYIGMAAHHPKYWDRKVVEFLQTRGRGKVLFGSDYPVVTYPESLPVIDQMEFKKDARAQLLWGTARRVFKLE